MSSSDNQSIFRGLGFRVYDIVIGFDSCHIEFLLLINF